MDHLKDGAEPRLFSFSGNNKIQTFAAFVFNPIAVKGIPRQVDERIQSFNLFSNTIFYKKVLQRMNSHGILLLVALREAASRKRLTK
ncbi:hypothetical protein [Halobacillus litoralis]|uniref:Uncharacterized protein n=1 Tax=Halobacillus litoralis TaxID=45668 RepID=A0A410MDF9_9BACI|nr:hypothetical protein [Halobacillus litoralis]QAS52759.1 hypothetical protein HLI_11420 [Halobacillus litoralis]